MKRICTITLTVLTIALTSCVTVKPLPDVAIPKDAKIGFITLVEEPPVIAQIGTTLLTNSYYHRTEEWGLSERLYNSLKVDLSAQGYELIKLDANSTLKLKKMVLISTGWDSFQLSSIASREIEQYGKNNNVDIIIIFSPYIHEGLRQSQGAITGYGLLSNCTFGSCQYEPFVRVRSIVTTTKSPQLIGWDNYKARLNALNISHDGDLEDLPSNEFNKAKEPVWAAIRTDAKVALTDAGLIQPDRAKPSNK